MTQQMNPPSGFYNIETSVDPGNSFWLQCTDHTNGTGNFFADPSGSAGTVVWEQTEPVSLNIDYTFSAGRTNISGITYIRVNNDLNYLICSFFSDEEGHSDVIHVVR